MYRNIKPLRSYVLWQDAEYTPSIHSQPEHQSMVEEQDLPLFSQLWFPIHFRNKYMEYPAYQITRHKLTVDAFHSVNTGNTRYVMIIHKR